jgi:hypothetical protein
MYRSMFVIRSFQGGVQHLEKVRCFITYVKSLVYHAAFRHNYQVKLCQSRLFSYNFCSPRLNGCSFRKTQLQYLSSRLLRLYLTDTLAWAFWSELVRANQSTWSLASWPKTVLNVDSISPRNSNSKLLTALSKFAHCNSHYLITERIKNNSKSYKMPCIWQICMASLSISGK